jgi:hypothetical protein
MKIAMTKTWFAAAVCLLVAQGLGGPAANALDKLELSAKTYGLVSKQTLPVGPESSKIGLGATVGCDSGDQLVSGGCQSEDDSVLLVGSGPDFQEVLGAKPGDNLIDAMLNGRTVVTGYRAQWACKWVYRQALVDDLRTQLRVSELPDLLRKWVDSQLPQAAPATVTLKASAICSKP